MFAAPALYSQCWPVILHVPPTRPQVYGRVEACFDAVEAAR